MFPINKVLVGKHAPYRIGPKRQFTFYKIKKRRRMHEKISRFYLPFISMTESLNTLPSVSNKTRKIVVGVHV